LAPPSDPRAGGASRRAILAGAAALAAVPAAALAAPRISDRLVDVGGGVQLRLRLAIPDTPAPAQGLPLLVVLDGDAWFDVAASIAAARREGIGPVAILGVGYPGTDPFNPRRLKDLTPWPPQTPLDGPQTGAPVGGADAFADAVLGRLLPLAAREVRIAPHRRALFGHSLGGLFALHMLFRRPDAFDAYVAASPSIWWDKARLLAEADAARFPTPPPRVLLTAGGLEDELGAADIGWLRRAFAADPRAFGGRSIDEVIEASRTKTASNRMPGNAREMAGLLRDRGLEAAYAEFAGETHMSSAPMAINRALSFVLEAG
jgi:predicted alpha/beta superfamily hydrolase